MEIIEKKKVPLYESVCLECKSRLRYRKADVRVTGYITCPVCGMPVWANTVFPVEEDSDG